MVPDIIALDMRIVIDVTPAVQQTAGIGKYARCLVENLLAMDHENVYSFFYNAYGKAEPDLLPADCLTHTVSLSDRRWRLWLLLAHSLGLGMDGYLGRGDIFHGTDYQLPLVKDSKAVVTIHDLSFLVFPQHHAPLNRLYLRWIVPKSVGLARAVIVDSESTKRDLMRWLGTPEEKVKAIVLGVDERFSPVPDQDSQARVEMKYSLRRPYLLFVGTIEPRKNLSLLLEAYRSLPAKVQHDLVIVGKKGWLYQGIFDQVRALGLERRVTFLGLVPEADLPALYRGAELFVYPSFYEGFGLPPLEAMACGTPVVTSNTSSLSEVVGDAGLMVAPTDAAGLATAIQSIISDEGLRTTLRARGLERAKQFTWQKTAQATLQVYQQVFSTAKEHEDRL
ncbi:MAG: glycosyltransferase family 4 protein [Chloroflexi bacterium]|nr:glycosyltransferase family 4 protein [Chloroflexota bacterium]